MSLFFELSPILVLLPVPGRLLSTVDHRKHIDSVRAYSVDYSVRSLWNLSDLRKIQLRHSPSRVGELCYPLLTSR